MYYLKPKIFPKTSRSSLIRQIFILLFCQIHYTLDYRQTNENFKKLAGLKVVAYTIWIINLF